MDRLKNKNKPGHFTLLLMVLYDVSESNWKGNMNIWHATKAVSNYGGVCLQSRTDTGVSLHVLFFNDSCPGPGNLQQPVQSTSSGLPPFSPLTWTVWFLMSLDFGVALKLQTGEGWLCCFLGTFCPFGYLTCQQVSRRQGACPQGCVDEYGRSPQTWWSGNKGWFQKKHSVLCGWHSLEMALWGVI